MIFCIIVFVGIPTILAYNTAISVKNGGDRQVCISLRHPTPNFLTRKHSKLYPITGLNSAYFVYEIGPNYEATDFIVHVVPTDAIAQIRIIPFNDNCR